MKNQINYLPAFLFVAALFFASGQIETFAQFPVKIPGVKISKPSAPTTNQTELQKPDQSNQSAVMEADGFKIGDTVEIYCDCLGRMEWTAGKIESISGSHYTVRYGNGRYQTKPISFGGSNMRDPKRAAVEARQREIRDQFWSEARKYNQSVYYFMSFHDGNLRVGNNIYGAPQNGKDWEKTMLELGELNQICTTKYSAMTNDPNNAFKQELNNLPGTWCEIAAKRFEYEKAGRAAVRDARIKSMNEGIIAALQKVIDDPENRITQDYQVLLFEREKWMREKKAELAPFFADLKMEAPADLLDSISSTADKLKKVVEENGARRNWEVPMFNRPAEQAIARAEFIKTNKGATVVKIGSNYSDWKIYKNAIGIPTDRYVRGWALLKIPNRPFCQTQEWIVKQAYAGGGRWSATTAYSVGGSGIFVKCQ